MLTNKYYENFITANEGIVNRRQLLKDIIETEEKTGVELLDWEEVQLSIFLQGSVSTAGVSKNFVVLKKFADFICKQENLPKRVYTFEQESLLDYVDKDSLKARTLSYAQYIDIKNQFNMEDLKTGERINTRNSVIFELAWTGLTNEEITNLKEEDIEFIGDIAILTLGERIVRLEDTEIIENVKLCMKETYYMVLNKTGFYNKYNYRDSEYLIKPANVGRSKDGNIKSMSIAFSNILRNYDVKCEGVNIEELCLNDIRRSKMIYMLAPENEEMFDMDTIMGIFNLRSASSLLWLKEIAKEIYPV